MKRYLFIYNPAARNGKPNGRLARLKKRVADHPASTILHSQKKGDIAQLVQQNINDYDVFVACGGDGTIGEMGGQLLHTGKELGIIPMGTGNDLSKTLKIPKDIDQALEIVFEQSSTAIDVGQFNDVIFLNTLGFGFDGLTNRYAYDYTMLPSFLRYAFAAIRASITHNRFTVHFNGDSSGRQLIMLSFANGRVEGGSFWIAPEASVTDQRLDMVSIRKVGKWLIPLLLPLFQFKKAGVLPQVQYRQIRKISFSLDTTPDIHADGEIIESEATQFTVTTLSRALNVICKL
ncbi:diacylglycerol/lipid kinase family protein [Fodinibius halophilus]|uniref:YegS/Rv2252/BmrU family lipid kinase n=1 Tax=Fodinibius halophilus TaxID=1736908 RepID=A0A6M1TG18_9BACT|nr:YegS/Rv2252/BmrU family lipid kinase [Fodinibius halophilus]NGP89052.1 YegS/Rv2252/BmrU family lipid kinase [Fodinibius halophilus]